MALSIGDVKYVKLLGLLAPSIARPNIISVMSTTAKILFAIETLTTGAGVDIPVLDLCVAAGAPADYAEAVADLVEKRFLLQSGASVRLTTDGARHVRALHAARV
jgi:hypothetical protein